MVKGWASILAVTAMKLRHASCAKKLVQQEIRNAFRSMDADWLNERCSTPMHKQQRADEQEWKFKVGCGTMLLHMCYNEPKCAIGQLRSCMVRKLLHVDSLV